MSEARDLTLTSDEQDLKVAQRLLIREFGGQVVAGEHFSRPQSRYSDCGSPNTRVHLTVREVAELEDRTVGRSGHPIVTRLLARRQGYDLVRRPDAAPGEADLLLRSGELVKEAGDVVSSLARALADRRFLPSERREVGAEIDQLIQVAVELRALVEAQGEGE